MPTSDMCKGFQQSESWGLMNDFVNLSLGQILINKIIQTILVSNKCCFTNI